MDSCRYRKYFCSTIYHMMHIFYTQILSVHKTWKDGKKSQDDARTTIALRTIQTLPSLSNMSGAGVPACRFIFLILFSQFSACAHLCKSIMLCLDVKSIQKKNNIFLMLKGMFHYFQSPSVCVFLLKDVSLSLQCHKPKYEVARYRVHYGLCEPPNVVNMTVD